MNSVSYDCFKNILSFLEPLDLCQTRKLNREYNSITDQFLKKMYNSTNLNNYVCPSCGSYYITNDEKNELNHSYFYDLPYGDPEEEENRSDMVQRVYRYNEVRRFQLICDDCEGKEIDIDFNDYIKNILILKRKILPYQGDRYYEIRIFGRGTNYPWVVLFYHNYNNKGVDNMDMDMGDDDDKIIIWNEVRSFIENMPIVY